MCYFLFDRVAFVSAADAFDDMKLPPKLDNSLPKVSSMAHLFQETGLKLGTRARKSETTGPTFLGGLPCSLWLKSRLSIYINFMHI